MMWKMLKHIGKTHRKRLIATFFSGWAGKPAHADISRVWRLGD